VFLNSNAINMCISALLFRCVVVVVFSFYCHVLFASFFIVYFVYEFYSNNNNLKLDDEAVRVAVGLRLGLDLCTPHECHCGLPVDARGLHSFVCRKAPGRTARHHALNDMVARSFASAGTPVTKKPSGLFRTDGKRPDGRSDTRPLAERQVIVLGRNCHLPLG